MGPPPPPEQECDICMPRCNPVKTANCVKCKNVYFHHACLEITSCSNVQALILWSFKICSSTFAAEILALDRIWAMEKKIERVNSIIRDLARLQNEVALLRKPDFPFLNAAKTGFHRNRIESFSSSQSIKKLENWRIRYGPKQRKLIVYLVTKWKHLAWEFSASVWLNTFPAA